MSYWSERLIKLWEDSNQYIFHLVICCSPQMRQMVALIRSGDIKSLDEHFATAQLYELNVHGLPCAHIAAELNRTNVLKHLISLNPEILNAQMGDGAYTVLHCALMRSGNENVVRLLVQEMSGVDHSARDNRNLTPFEWALGDSWTDPKLIYNALSPREKGTMNVCDLLHRIVLTMMHSPMDENFEITSLLLEDRDFDWRASAHGPHQSPYCSASHKYEAYSAWVTSHAKEMEPDVVDEHIQYRDAAIRMFHKLNDGLVPLRCYDEHGTTLILTLFENAPFEVLQALYESLPRRRQEKGEIIVCSSMDLDGDTGYELGKRRGGDLEKLALQWRQYDLQPEVLQHFVDQKDYRQVAELLYDQDRFQQALEYLTKVEPSDWTICMRARTLLKLGRHSEALKVLEEVKENSSVLLLKSQIASDLGRRSTAISLNRAAYAIEVERKRRYPQEVLQKELCEEILKLSILPLEMRITVGDHMPIAADEKKDEKKEEVKEKEEEEEEEDDDDEEEDGEEDEE